MDSLHKSRPSKGHEATGLVVVQLINLYCNLQPDVDVAVLAARGAYRRNRMHAHDQNIDLWCDILNAGSGWTPAPTKSLGTKILSVAHYIIF